MFWNLFFEEAIYGQFFFQIQILNLCSEMHFFEGAIYIQFFFQYQILNSKKSEFMLF